MKVETDILEEIEKIRYQKLKTSRSHDNLVKWKSSLGTSKVKTKRECCCIQEYNQLKNKIRTLQAITESENKQSKSGKCKPRMMNPEKKRVTTISEPSRNDAKTWFQVLQESPKKQITNKISNNTDERHQRFSNRANLLENDDSKGLTSLLDDEKFLKTLIRMNDIIQSECRDTRKDLRTHPENSVTDDDKFKSYMGQKLQEQSQEQKEKQNLQAKALVKLLQNMQSVYQNSEIQRETLDNLTRQVIQLREENKMLDKLKEVRIDLESKLASLTTENIFLKKQLQVVEKERDKANSLLEARENEILTLKKHMTVIKGKIANKIDSGIKYDLDDLSVEFNLEDTLASVPSCNQCFDAPIRPASSSPTEEVVQKWRNKSVNGRLNEDSGIQSNPRENCQSPFVDKSLMIRKQVLSDLKNNVKKTVEEFQLDMKFNDESLNLSDATYKLNSSSII